SCAANVSSDGRTAPGNGASAETGVRTPSAHTQVPCGCPGPSAVKASVLPSVLQLGPLTTGPGSEMSASSGKMVMAEEPPRTFHSTAARCPSAVSANASTSADGED